MKILKLNLTAFGPFTDAQLDLSKGNQGLHVIYGPNEAGKSSSLRAITDLLYGVPARTPDNFIHPYPKLRLGAQLQHSDGTVLEIVRRKASKNSLFNGDDSLPLDETELTRLMGDVDRELFHMMFGIDHERLRRGGEEIVQGDGRIGELLFAAGAGLADLQAVQTKLHEEMDVLLKGTGRSGTIVTEIKEFQNEHNAVKQAQASVETWQHHDDNLRAANESMDKLDQSIEKDRSEQNRLTRIRDAISSIGKWKKAKEDLSQVSDVPLLSADFDKTSNEILIDLRTVEQQKADAEASLVKLDKDLEELVVPEQLLQESDATESLRDRLGGYRKAMSDRPKLKTSRELAENEAKEILREIGRTPDLSTIEDLRLPADKTVRIQNLGNQQEGLVARVQSTRRECEKTRSEITRIETTLAEIQIPKAAESLRSSLRNIQNEGALDSRHESAIAELTELRQSAAVVLGQLGLWSGSLEDVEKLAVPSLATIEQYSEEIKDKSGLIKSIRARLKEKTTEKEQLDAQLKQLELGQRIATDEELENSRRRREQGWQLVLNAWNKDQEDETAVHEFLHEFSPLTSIADAYRRSVEEADQMVDQLRSDADRVATKVKIQADIEQRLAEADRLEESLQVAEADSLHVKSQWNETWASLSIKPLSPLEMRDWLHKQQDLSQAAAELRSKQHEEAELRTHIDAKVDELKEVLKAVDPSYSAEDDSLRELVRRASDKSDEIQKSENRRDQLTKDFESNRNDLVDAESRFSDSENDLTQWRSNWAAEMLGIGLQNDAMPAQANSVLANVNRLFQKFQESDQYRVRLEGIDRDAREFDTDVSDLVGRTLPELAAKPVEDVVVSLSTKLKAARSAEEKRASLLERSEEQSEKLREAMEQISGYKASLDEMCRQAACESYKQLSEAANDSRRRRELERSVEEFEELIVSQSGGGKFETFLAEADAVDIDSLQPQIDKLGESLGRLGIERDEVIGLCKAESIELRKIKGGSVAFGKTALCESIASGLEDQVRELAKLRICSALLNAAIEEHRGKNQGPVLRRASTIFSQITLGSFKELRADFNDRGEPVLTGVRATIGEAVPVSGMSDGTCDQLYLALRLASLETWLDRHESIPFIVDDVLLNFDDSRAIASLEVLAELSHRTQVVFFTHHQHLVDMAKDSVSSNDLFVTTLQGT
ncbi:MAG: AAA family ATPase [Rubripirellula sp.]|nr:AAA family ATPase [Rubripirellula sp.]